MYDFFRDLKTGGRNLMRSPGFSLVAVTALSLGIGLSSALFSVIDAVLLDPLPYPDPGRIVWMWGRNSGNSQARVSPPDFRDYARGQRSFESFAAFVDRPAVIGGTRSAERVQGLAVTAEYFDVFAATPQLGRIPSPEDFKTGATPRVAISDGLWKRRFGSDPALLGKDILVDGLPHRLVAVLPAGFGFLPPSFHLTEAPDLWLPLDPDGPEMQVRRFHFLTVLGRLREGASLARAQQELDLLAAGLAESFPDSNQGWGLNLIPFSDQLVSGVRPALAILFGAVALVLLLACVNVANLQIVRALARRPEIALRNSLGASRGRLVRQLMAENLLLALASAGAGLVLAVGGVRLLSNLIPAGIPRAQNISVDARVLLFTIALALATSLLFGLLPAFQGSKSDPNRDLKAAGRSDMGDFGTRRLRSSLVVVEVALAVALVAGAGLLLRSFWALVHVDAGFAADRGVLTLRISPPAGKYDESSRTARFYRQALDETSALPGVVSAGLVNRLPIAQGGWDTAYVKAGEDLSDAGVRRYSYVRAASDGYFESLGIPLLSGRTFDRRDESDSPVVIVSQAFAQAEWPGEEAVGKRLLLDLGDAVDVQVVGVVGGVRQSSLTSSPWKTFYLPFFDGPDPGSVMNLIVRSRGDASSMASRIRQRIERLDPSVAVSNVQTTAEIVRQASAASRFQTLVLGIFAALALLLAAIGVFGMLSYGVSQRRREIGIRMALGADRSRIVRMVVGSGFRQAALGCALGLLGSMALSRSMASVLFQVSPRDPWSLGAAAALLLLVALAASLHPARRAGSLDPIRTLRSE